MRRTKTKKDAREKSWAEQRKKRGFDDRDTWSLDHTIAEFVEPRLKRFKEICGCTPGSLTDDEWINILNKMIRAFELSAKGNWILSDKERKEMKEGLKLFAEWFDFLWW